MQFAALPAASNPPTALNLTMQSICLPLHVLRKQNVRQAADYVKSNNKIYLPAPARFA